MPLSRHAARLRFALQIAFITIALAACSTSKPANDTDDSDETGAVKEHRDHWRQREAQSDFLDIGKQAGIEWLSFVQQDQQDYPEYFEGRDRDQRRRLRLAPKESDERVLIQFDLPEGSKLWPVDWYGTELLAIDLPGAPGFSVAIADGKLAGIEAATAIAKSRAKSIEGAAAATDQSGFAVVTSGNHTVAVYGQTALSGRTGTWVVIVEALAEKSALSAAHREGLARILSGMSIKREIALEGSPKHKVMSTLDEQLSGTLRYRDGVLKLPIAEGQLVRKIGGDSTIQIDGVGAEPWILIRRMKPPEEDMRTALRGETTIKRRRDVPSGRFGKGFTPEGAKLPMVVFEYGDSGAENELVGVLKAGNELLVFEVVSTGLRDGDKRREAKDAALKLLAGATAEPATEAPEFERLIGWNPSE